MPASYSRPFTGRPALYRLPGDRRPPWVCTCHNRKPYARHAEPFQCRLEPTVIGRVLGWLREEFER